jgi:hypothetical protein
MLESPVVLFASLTRDTLTFQQMVKKHLQVPKPLADLADNVRRYHEKKNTTKPNLKP